MPDKTQTGRRPVLILLVLLMSGLCPGQRADISETTARVRPAHYNIAVEIVPGQGYLQASAAIRLVLEQPAPPTLSFFLHETFRIDELVLNGHRTPFSMTPAPPQKLHPARQRVDIQLDEKTRALAQIDIVIRYGGVLKRLPQWGKQKRGKLALDDHIGPERVELAAYSAWYPQWPEKNWFSLELEITLPANWKTVASGERTATRVKQNRIHTSWASPRNQDLVVVASPDFKEIQVPAGSGFGTISVFHTRLPVDFIQREAGEISHTLKYFLEWLGPLPHTGSSLRHVYSPREMGQGGYSRPGLVVTSEGRILAALESTPTLSFRRGNAHELAHFWWNFGRGQADWINEAFAEYFSLLVLEAAGNAVDTAVYLKKCAERVRTLPQGIAAMSKVPADNSEANYVIRYCQGALMLHHFRSRMDDGTFLAACRGFYLEFREAGADTQDFRDYWSRQKGLDPATVNRWLDTPGNQIVFFPETNK